MPVISFVMLTWNRKLFLQKSLESFYNSFSKRFTYEFLIIDNGSNDGTVDVLKEYEKKDSNLRIVYNEKNNGLQEYVKLFSMARGKYIIELDDDVIEYPKDFDLLMIQYKKIFHRFGMLCLDVVKNEYTNGAKPDDSFYTEEVRKNKVVQVGPCGGWCTIFSKLDYNFVRPFFSIQRLDMKNGEDGQLMSLFRKILRKKFGVIKDVKCLHACGPKYSKMFGYLDRDIEKYGNANLDTFVEMYSSER